MKPLNKNQWIFRINRWLARKNIRFFYLLQQEKLSKKENANALNNNENKCTKAME